MRKIGSEKLEFVLKNACDCAMKVTVLIPEMNDTNTPDDAPELESRS